MLHCTTLCHIGAGALVATGQQGEVFSFLRTTIHGAGDLGGKGGDLGNNNLANIYRPIAPRITLAYAKSGRFLFASDDQIADDHHRRYMMIL